MGVFFLVVEFLLFTLKKRQIRQDPDGVSSRGLVLANGLPTLAIGKNMALPDGFEPPTKWLTATCSTN